MTAAQHDCEILANTPGIILNIYMIYYIMQHAIGNFVLFQYFIFNRY